MIEILAFTVIPDTRGVQRRCVFHHLKGSTVREDIFMR